MHLHHKMLVVIRPRFTRHHIAQTLGVILLDDLLQLGFVILLSRGVRERLRDKRQDEPARHLHAAVEIQRRNDLIEWAASMQKIAAEQAEYDAAQEAAMLARNATGDYGEVFEP